jgi:transposase
MSLMKEIVLPLEGLTKKEQGRLKVLNQVERRERIGREAAEVLGISMRHVRRLLAAYRKEGATALAHGNRGRKPCHALGAGLKRNVLELARSTYAGFNTQHFTEIMAEREGISLSRASVRRILLGGGIKSPRKRRPPKHRSRRERYPQEGMLLQIDGSSHDWLEGRGPWLNLIGAIDDATGKVPYALFREQEDAQGGISSCSAGLWLTMLYRWLYTVIAIVYLSVPRWSQRLWRSNLRGNRSQPSLAGWWRSWALLPSPHAHPKLEGGLRGYGALSRTGW